MKLDREIQRQVLNSLREIYPELTTIHSDIFTGIEIDVLRANVAYLHGHRLIEAWNSHLDDQIGLPSTTPPQFKISSSGLDFLEQDGGLSAILGTVTVKLHADTIRDLLETRIMESQLPVAEKKRFVDQLKELPGEALKTLTNKLIEKACDNPEAVVSVFNSIF